MVRSNKNLDTGLDMKDNVYYIARLYTTVLETGNKQTGFYHNGINFKASKGTPDTLRGFFNALWCRGNMLDFESSVSGSIPGGATKISGFQRLFPDSRKVDKGIDKPYLERVKEFSPEMDFFSSSTVMPQRDLTGQDFF